jgi:hypothetical protein
MMMEQFTIHDTVDNFASWVNSYGEMKQPIYYVPNRPQRERLLHQAGDEHESFGHIVFSFKQDANIVELFHVTAEPWNGDHPPSKRLIDYLRGMAAAIHARWGQQPKTQKIPLPDTPPIPFADEYTWNDLFDWWYRIGKLDFHDLKDLAPAVMRSEQTVYNNHTLYTKSYGEEPIPDNESRFSRNL